MYVHHECMCVNGDPIHYKLIVASWVVSNFSCNLYNHRQIDK